MPRLIMPLHPVSAVLMTICLIVIALFVLPAAAQPDDPNPHLPSVTTFTFDDDADPAVWFTGDVTIAPQDEGGDGLALTTDDALVSLNRPLFPGDTLGVTVRRGVGAAGVRLVSNRVVYMVWLGTDNIAILQRNGAEMARTLMTAGAQRVTLHYSEQGHLTARVGDYAFPVLEEEFIMPTLLVEFVVRGANDVGAAFDDITVPLPTSLIDSVGHDPDGLDLLLDVDRDRLTQAQAETPYSINLNEDVPVVTRLTTTEPIEHPILITVTFPYAVWVHSISIPGMEQPQLDAIMTALTARVTRGHDLPGGPAMVDIRDLNAGIIPADPLAPPVTDFDPTLTETFPMQIYLSRYGVRLTYVYTSGLLPGDVYEIDLTAQALRAGVFDVDGEASTLRPVDPIPDGINRAAIAP